MKRILLITLAAVAAAALLAWALLPGPRPVETARVSQERFERSVLEDGRTRLRSRYTLSAPQAGQLDRIALQAGDPVARGQVVAELHPLLPTLLDARSRAEQLERIAAAQASLARAQAASGRASAAQALARSTLTRSESLAAQGFVSPGQNDNARTELQVREQELAAARQEEAAAAHALAQARATLDTGAAGGVAPVAAGRYRVRSPVAGRVLKVLQASAGVVGSGTPLLEIGDPLALEVVADLLTEEAAQLRPGTPVRLTDWGGPDALEGRVQRVEPAAFTKVSALGVEEQRVRVVIDLLSPPERRSSLGDGFKVGVALRVQQVESAIVVPVGALFPQGGRSAVFALVDGRARLREVTVGARNASQAWVQAGLTPGMTVLLYPDANLKDGDAVKPR